MNLYRPKSDDIAWGECVCSMKYCMALAECLFDDIPLCLDCADDLLDRQIAISLNPNMRQLLPEIGDC